MSQFMLLLSVDIIFSIINAMTILFVFIKRAFDSVSRIKLICKLQHYIYGLANNLVAVE